MSERDKGFAFLLVLCAGLSTSLGALAPFLLKTSSNNGALAAALGFSAGAMIYVSLIKIFSESRDSFQEILEEQNATLATLACFFGGVFLGALLDAIVHKLNPHHAQSHESHSYDPAKNLAADSGSALAINSILEQGAGESESSPLVSQAEEHDGPPPPCWKSYLGCATPAWNNQDPNEEGRLKAAGLVTAIAIAIHNFPEGLATFMAFLTNPGVGISLGFAVVIHNIPAGISIAMPIYFATKSRLRAFLFGALPGLTQPLGAALGWAITSVANHPLVFGILFGIVAGMLLFISVKEQLPAAHRKDPADRFTSWAFMAGTLIMAMSLFFLELVGF